MLTGEKTPRRRFRRLAGAVLLVLGVVVGVFIVSVDVASVMAGTYGYDVHTFDVAAPDAEASESPAHQVGPGRAGAGSVAVHGYDDRSNLARTNARLDDRVLAPNTARPVETLFHYTDEAGQAGIRASGELRPSLRSVNPRDVRYGEGQYVSDIVPGTRTCAQLSRCFLGQPFQGNRFTHYVEIDVRGLNVVKGRDGVFVVPGQTPLDLTDRLVSWGANGL